jgi:hypothetical protein
MNMTHTFSEIKKNKYQNYRQLLYSMKCDMVLEGSQSRSEVFTLVLLTIHVFWNVTVRGGASTS